MQDRDLGQQFDRDPVLDRPLRAATSQFLTAFREEVRQRKEFVLNQIIGDAKPKGSGFYDEGIWTERFVDRIFNVKSAAKADSLLLPWVAWDQFHTSLYQESMEQKGDTGEKFAAYEERFRTAGIPTALQDQMGRMSEDNFRFNAKHYLFHFTGLVKEAIDMLEELPRSVSAETVFRVQRITGEPLWSVGGLRESVKPNIKRIFIEEKPYIVLFPDDERTKDYLDEDDANEAHWQRWNSLEVGMHVRNAQQGNSQTYDKTFGKSGTVVGFSIEGAGELMMYQPGIKNIVVYVREDGNGFLRDPLLRQIALDTEPADIHHFTDVPFTRSTAAITTIDFQSGRVSETDIQHPQVADFVKDELEALGDNGSNTKV